MAITKKFQDLVAKVCNSNVGELLRQIGEHAVRYAYSAHDPEPAQYALDTLPDAWRDPLASWLRARGLIVGRKAIGSSRYVVGETDDAGIMNVVKSKKRQQKAMQDALEVPVLEVSTQTVRAPKKVTKLEGAPKDRANKAAERLVAKVRKDDPEAAAVLNERLTRAAPKSNTLTTSTGVVELTAEEVELILEALTEFRVEQKVALAA